MSPRHTIDVLNRLSVLHSRSLPVYLSDARPWFAGNNGQAMAALEHIVSDQQAMADRLGELIVEFGGDVDPGEFPLAFTALHDLSFDYLLQRMIQLQEKTVAEIEDCVGGLNLAPLARSLAEESLGEAQGHLDTLRSLAGEPNRS